MTTFFVPGIPAPQGSKTVNPNGRSVRESSKGVKPWRAAVSRIAAAECSPITGPVAVELEFVMPRPKATPKTKPTPPAVKRPDLDKLVRSTLDGLTGRAYGDDSQVIRIVTSKRIAEIDEPTGCLIRVQVSRPANVIYLDDLREKKRALLSRPPDPANMAVPFPDRTAG